MRSSGMFCALIVIFLIASRGSLADQAMSWGTFLVSLTISPALSPLTLTKRLCPGVIVVLSFGRTFGYYLCNLAVQIPQADCTDATATDRLDSCNRIWDARSREFASTLASSLTYLTGWTGSEHVSQFNLLAVVLAHPDAQPVTKILHLETFVLNSESEWG